MGRSVLIDRRGFVTALMHAGAAALALPAAASARQRDALAGTCFAVLAAGDGHGGARRDGLAGARLGAAEAERAALLLRRPLTFIEWTGAPPDSPDTVTAWLRENAASILVGGFDEAECRTLATATDAAGALLLNIGCGSDGLRGAGCARHVFHIAASDRMLRDVLAAHAGVAGSAAAGRTNAAIWHPALTRFGAAQVNERFREETGHTMSGAAWAGWAAVKIAADAALRARGTDGAALAEHFRSPRTQFDGHKGWPLSFRAWDGQLRQPLYVVGPATAAEPAGALMAELPAAGARAGQDSRSALDRFGAGAAAGGCALVPEGAA
jgi:hypothetical protein